MHPYKTALDRNEYNILLLVGEETDAYDQTGTCITQIFSLALYQKGRYSY